MQHLPTLAHLTQVVNSVSENWKGSEKKTEPATKSLLPPSLRKETSAILPWPPERPYFFLSFWAPFQAERGREEWEGRQGAGAGSRTLTKNHFNRDH